MVKTSSCYNLLHSLFILMFKKVTLDENEKKSTIKYCIKDAQNTFILVGSTAVELELFINKLKSNIYNRDYYE